ncbi:MAG: antitoxin [Chloroflexi bacterium]|nr:antitoxin [Chloroflexota bacterium]
MKRKTYDVQVRGVPAALRDGLKRRAAGKGVSMSRYVIRVLTDDIERPTLEEWIEETGKLPRVEGISGAELIREIRREAEEGLED